MTTTDESSQPNPSVNSAPQNQSSTQGAPPELGMVGLGRMGANLVRRLVSGGGRSVVFDTDPAVAAALAEELGSGVRAASTLAELVAALPTPRAIWVMVPASVAGAVVSEIADLIDPGDVIIDGGNTDWREDGPRGAALAERNISLLDVGTSGGVWGLERGYCMMVGGAEEAVLQLRPVFDILSPPADSVERTPGRDGDLTQAEQGWLHCGPTGSGHFVKMVHNGIEYGLMGAYAEGLNLLGHTAPYGFDVDIPAVTELWRRGSVVGSWLLDLTAAAFVADPTLDGFTGVVSDSGEGRWSLEAAVDLGVPAPVLASALFSRFSSRGEETMANKVLSAMRNEFGGHVESSAP
ncbi:6-phosphogluconate dehydrogenase, decarboxylating [Actinobacteria bacterium IMCC26207]|nr:6-phosphogluconate dehydrogenase, decarboxylating [Actinobacteria bacterium IMCC26207]